MAESESSLLPAEQGLASLPACQKTHNMYAKIHFVAVTSSTISMNSMLLCAHCMRAAINVNPKARHALSAG